MLLRHTYSVSSYQLESSSLITQAQIQLLIVDCASFIHQKCRSFIIMVKFVESVFLNDVRQIAHIVQDYRYRWFGNLDLY